ncbi:MAG: NUDIX hydrolase [Hyphomicrobiales bacterium]
MTGHTKAAAVSLIERGDEVLVVWNRRYNGWTLPGGLCEEGEAWADAQKRELREETSLETASAELIYSALTEREIDPHRGSVVYVFRVVATGQPRDMEHGCPVAWMKRADFLELCPFRKFYRRMFASCLCPRTPTGAKRSSRTSMTTRTHLRKISGARVCGLCASMARSFADRAARPRRKGRKWTRI